MILNLSKYHKAPQPSLVFPYDDRIAEKQDNFFTGSAADEDIILVTYQQLHYYLMDRKNHKSKAVVYQDYTSVHQKLL